MSEEFYIGQIFEGDYPPEAAIWCDDNNASIDELDPIEDVRRFQINLTPEPTEEKIRILQIENLKQQIDELDKKRIRAIAEPSIKDEITNETWLDYYNNQITVIREQIQNLQEGINKALEQ